jgi:hypothetical protein
LVQAQEDSVSTGSPPRLFLSIDYGKIATLPTNFETKIEGGLGFRVGKHLMPVIYSGTSTLQPDNAIVNGTYQSKGWYFRAGLEYIFSLDLRNNLIFGARYGQSFFNEELTYVIESELFDNLTGSAERYDLGAAWTEVVVGSEMQLGEGPFFVGGYFTFRILVNRDEFEPFDTERIPGYGRTVDKTVPALQLYLKLALIR